jgi:uncharacterized membrane protein YgcG
MTRAELQDLISRIPHWAQVDIIHVRTDGDVTDLALRIYRTPRGFQSRARYTPPPPRFSDRISDKVPFPAERARARDAPSTPPSSQTDDSWLLNPANPSSPVWSPPASPSCDAGATDSSFSGGGGDSGGGGASGDFN